MRLCVFLKPQMLDSHALDLMCRLVHGVVAQLIKTYNSYAQSNVF